MAAGSFEIQKILNSPNLEDRCVGKKFDRPYDSQKYPIESPILYVQGSVDPATPLEGAKYHFDNQKISSNKKFLDVKFGGHNPVHDQISKCFVKILSKIDEQSLDSSGIVDDQGYCKYNLVFLSNMIIFYIAMIPEQRKWRRPVMSVHVCVWSPKASLQDSALLVA